MVPAPYLAALERMQDNVAPVPFEAIRAVVEDALGVRISKAFATFDENPLGGASLAQVHRATLRDGRDVAVKVQRPGITDQILGDLDALASLAGKADRMTNLGRRVRFADWVHEFRKTLLAELDYRESAWAEHETIAAHVFSGNAGAAETAALAHAIGAGRMTEEKLNATERAA
jgi:predicted unusual protein kinase regulating ubiquinone biosynthesis (AarF/ABC1/UbiB family)